MSRNKLVILGASGFVGTMLTERLREAADWTVVPVIHSAGSAWRLARHGAPLVQADIQDKASLREVLSGATHVVNCTRGGRDVMVDAFPALLAACRAAGVQRFVHLSSVLVYGDPPHPQSADEEAPADERQGPDTYGGMKLEQDRLVQRAAKDGLPSVVLCPPNISGPFSPYLAGLVQAIRQGSFALMDDGSAPCNVVDVRNLCHAIELALAANGPVLDGRRLFVNDGGAVSWGDVIGGLMPLLPDASARRITRDQLSAAVASSSAKPRASLGRALRHLVSSDVRAALRQDPLLAKVDRAARGAVARAGSRIEGRLRRGIEGTLRVAQPRPTDGLALGLCAQQLRGVAHRSDRARQLLGYEPPVDYNRSMADFIEWYRCFHGMDSPSWDLAAHLYRA